MTDYAYPTAFRSWGAEERAAIDRVIASDRFTMGAETEAFEAEIAAYHGRKHAVACNSGSSANLLAVAAVTGILNIFPSDHATASVPALAWATTYAPLVQHGLKLVPLDCDETWNSHPSSQRARHVRIVMAASILGNPGYLDEWERVTDSFGAVLIEDNCESLGARTPSGRLTGTFGVASTLSGFWSHQLSAIELGVVMTDNSHLNRWLRILRDHGMDRSVRTEAPSFDREYDFVTMGYNLRPVEMHCAIAREQLKKLSSFIAARRANEEVFWEMATGRSLPIRRVPCRHRSSPFGIAFTLHDPARRSALAAALRAASIDCRPPTGGSFLRHLYGAPYRAEFAGTTPIADHVHDAGLFLGNAPYPIPIQIERAVDVIATTLTR